MNVDGVPQSLPADLASVVEAFNERLNVCRLLSLADLRAELPARPLSRADAEALVAALADVGIHLPDADPVGGLSGA